MTTHSAEILEHGIEAFLDRYRNKELLRILTCGSVDDGKSTLIGRLLHDSEGVFEDQMAAVKKDSVKYGTTGEEIDFALIVDGLQAEREQGITIDVAYRYFSTPRRKFIIADTPGHEQYTRNMATGASNSDLAVILIDARHGVLPQTRRHAFITSLLGIRHVVVAINKMDLVDYSRDVYDRISADFTDFAAKLQTRDIHFIPMAARSGENVVHRAESMAWYAGSPLLNYLESVHIASDRNLIDLRFPVQNVLRPDLNFRGYAGTIASGILRRGEEVVALPSGRRSRVKSLVTFDGEVDEAYPPMAITVTLEDEIDISRGDMLVHPNNAPHLSHEVEAMIVWMHDKPLKTGSEYLIKHTSVQTSAKVTSLRYRININTLRSEDASGLALNEIGRVALETHRPLCEDSYERNQTTGSFILIDRLTNATLAAGMIVDRPSTDRELFVRRASGDAGSNVREPQSSLISTAERSAKLDQKAFTVWLTGLPRSGKTTLAFRLERALFDLGFGVCVIDGEIMRSGISRDLGFSGADRRENMRRSGAVAQLLGEQGLITICAFVSPLSEHRDQARETVGDDRFVEVYCNSSLEACEKRDTAGLFAAARRGEATDVTGINAPYEPPANPSIELDTETKDVDTNLALILAHLNERGLLARPSEA